MSRSCRTVMPHGSAALPVIGASYPLTEATLFIIGKPEIQHQVAVGGCVEIRLTMPHTNSRVATKATQEIKPSRK